MARITLTYVIIDEAFPQDGEGKNEPTNPNMIAFPPNSTERVFDI